MSDDQKSNKAPKNGLQLVKFGEPQQEQADRDLRNSQGNKCLHPIQVVVFQEFFIIVVGKIVFVPSEAVENHGDIEAQANGVGRLR